MSGKYLGSYVSVDCGEMFGCYQGQVSNVDTFNQTITLKDVWKNGLKSSTDDVTLLAKDILDLSIIPSPKEDKTGSKADIEHLESQRIKKTTLPDTPSKLSKIKGRVGKDDVCFGTDVNMEKDFDFETNLALFDKKTVMGEIQSGKQQGPPPGPGTRTVSNFRHDENVLETLPPTYRQIHLPSPSTKEFLTDAGLVVPSASAELRKAMQDSMEKLGISIERRSESIARAVAEVALHFVGGPHRLTPKNSHQKPVVVVLCGNHPEAAGAVCAARHLATLGVQTVVYLQTLTVSHYLKKEIELYKLTGQSVINNEKHLPSASVDLIIASLLPPTWVGGDEIPKMKGIIEWANKQRAPTMAIDQPPYAVINTISWLDVKCTLSADLPLAYGDRDGKLYLYSLSTPRKVFQSLGIEYDSPFGSKFVITLHEAC
ncbi:hypothetical protein GHT06_018199 [Daphnia sinensis]|uniref:Enhancer of mRNA-decapping protein 3 n=1 Tax=Daphnia sinensis TaxID=1820382 RepID=A0AAD5KMW5_9CRUS|nr:hypothetical protein GHT06_018199 [Daphnia sinensis]